MNWLADRGDVKVTNSLDIGPRDCFIMGHLLKHGAKTVKGIEVSPPAARYCREMGYDVVEGDVRAMPYEDGEFDLVNCLHVLEHVPEPDKAIAEMWRVLKPGGHMYVVVPVEGGVEGKRKGAHYSYFESGEALADRVLANIDEGTVEYAIGTIKNDVKEIRLAARKGA